MTSFDRAAIVTRLRRTLLANANRAGGWGYYAGKRSRIEPTSWSLLALAESADRTPSDGPTDTSGHWHFLAACQRADGLLVDAPGLPPNFTANGVVACALLHLAPPKSQQQTELARILDAIVSVKGASVRAAVGVVEAIRRFASGTDPDQESGQNNSLQAWPWIPDTFSWVEPTSWCLLALKKAPAAGRARGAEARIREADALLINRICTSGGWNYGNAAVFDQDLRAYVPTTAVGLMALQDRRSEPAVDRTVAFLDRARVKEPSGMALGLTALALRLCGMPVDDVEEQIANDVERAIRLGNLQTLAMMLFALTADRHGVRAFRV